MDSWNTHFQNCLCFCCILLYLSKNLISGLVVSPCHTGTHLTKCMSSITVNKSHLRKIIFLRPLRIHGSKERHRGRTRKLPESFTNLEWPSSYCQSSHRATIKFFAHLFFSSFFVSWEDTSLEKPLRLLFKGPCVAGWQRTPLSAFSLIWKDRVKLKRGFSAPSPKTLSTPAPTPSLPPASPAWPGWTPLVGSQTSPVCVIPVVLWEADKEQEAQGSVGQAWRSAQSVSTWWMQHGGQVTWKCTKQDVYMHARLRSFYPSNCLSFYKKCGKHLCFLHICRARFFLKIKKLTF